MKPEPVLAPESNGEREFYDYYASSRRSAIDRLKGTFDDLNRRVQSMEETVIDKEYDWEQRLKAGS